MPLIPGPLFVKVSGRFGTASGRYVFRTLGCGRIIVAAAPDEMGTERDHPKIKYNQRGWNILDNMWNELTAQEQVEWMRCTPKKQRGHLSGFTHFKQINLNRFQLHMQALRVPPLAEFSRKEYRKLPDGQGKPIPVWVQGLDKHGHPFDPDHPAKEPPDDNPCDPPGPPCPDYAENVPERQLFYIMMPPFRSGDVWPPWPPWEAECRDTCAAAFIVCYNPATWQFSVTKTTPVCIGIGRPPDDNVSISFLQCGPVDPPRTKWMFDIGGLFFHAWYEKKAKGPLDTPAGIYDRVRYAVWPPGFCMPAPPDYIDVMPPRWLEPKLPCPAPCEETACPDELYTLIPSMLWVELEPGEKAMPWCRTCEQHITWKRTSQWTYKPVYEHNRDCNKPCHDILGLDDLQCIRIGRRKPGYVFTIRYGPPWGVFPHPSYAWCTYEKIALAGAPCPQGAYQVIGRHSTYFLPPQWPDGLSVNTTPPWA